MAKKIIEKYIYNKIEVDTNTEVKWLVMFDLFGWPWSYDNGSIYLQRKNQDDIKVVFAEINWKSYETCYINKSGKDELILWRHPNIEFANHEIGLFGNKSFTPVCVSNFIKQGSVDNVVGLMNKYDLKINIMSNDKQKFVKHLSLRKAWQYASTFNYKLFNRATDKMAEKLELRTNYDMAINTL